MKKLTKYLNIQIAGQPQIGIIELVSTEENFKKIGLKLDSHVKRIVEPKLVTALKEHYNCPIKIRSINVKSYNPMKVEVIVVIEDEGGDYAQGLDLKETWLY